MRALRYDAFGGPVSVVDARIPRPEPGGAVLRVTRSGLCRSDWHGWRGHDPDVVLPCTPGHEYAGVVVETAADVDRAWVGRRVTVPFVCGCGRCRQCLAGMAQVCPNGRQPGFTEPGSFAEYVAVPAAGANLVSLPDTVSDEAAASLGCRFATAWRAVLAVGSLQVGESVVILGCGGVGLAAAAIARAQGAGVVVAVDVSDEALALAAAAGARTVAVEADTPAGEIAAAVTDVLPGGADIGVDALGSATLAAASLLALRPRGRHVQVGLLATGHAELPLGRVIARELQVLGSHGMAAADYPEMVAAVADHRVRPDALVAGTVGLAEAADRLTTMDRPHEAGVWLVDPSR